MIYATGLIASGKSTYDTTGGEVVGSETLIEYLQAVARNRGCPGMDLESGTHRTRAHRFYFREGFFITAFSFRKEIP